VVLSNACCPRLRIYCLLWPEEEVYEGEDEKVEDDDDGNADGNVERSSPSTAQTCRAASIMPECVVVRRSCSEWML
jgi:hypothetical protein